MDYLKAEDKVMVAPGASYTAPADTSEIETLRNQVKAIIVQESWKMSFASSDAEFESLLAGMQETAKGLGYDQVLEVDMANAKEQDALRQESAAGSLSDAVVTGGARGRSRTPPSSPPLPLDVMLGIEYDTQPDI